MNWIIFALISALATGVIATVHRKVMLKGDPFSYAFIEQCIVTVLFIPFVIANFKFELTGTSFILILLSAFLWTLIVIIGHYGYKYADASIKSIINQSKIVFTLLFAVLFLKETVTLITFLGTALIFGGLAVLTFSKKENLLTKGIIFTLISAAITGLVTVIDKAALFYTNPETLGFLLFGIPALFMSVYVAQNKTELKTTFFDHKKYILLMSVLSITAFYFTLKTLSVVEASTAYPLLRASPVFTFIVGFIWLKERSHIGRKIASLIITTVGIVLLSL